MSYSTQSDPSNSYGTKVTGKRGDTGISYGLGYFGEYIYGSGYGIQSVGSSTYTNLSVSSNTYTDKTDPNNSYTVQ